MGKLTSRKFWVAIGTIIVTIILGLGYELDPKLIALLTTSESALWIVVEGIIDAIRAGKRE